MITKHGYELTLSIPLSTIGFPDRLPLEAVELSHFNIRCTSCGAAVPTDMATFRCPDCGSTLEVVYTDAGHVGPQPVGWTGPTIPLPVHDADSFVSLGEGDTPCVALPALGSSLGLDRLTAKLEFLNPTGSFKDRGTVVMMSVARELDVTEVVEDSSGN
ncbi:MAG: pyridoxal-phosphate dependent enzyme, partial [Chloroflexi bacterium]|nr:pyridoxal-phosphate dependent enzyme [Chloroflexota bacterium]